MVAVTSAFDVANPLRITLFDAGAAFEGALLAPDPQPRDRVRTLGWAAVVAAVAVVATVALNQTAVWVAAALLVLLMFSSYALRSWSPRVASLALMGAITVYITGAGYITIGRIGWFVLALVVGFGWLALWETLILPDNPLRSLNLSVQAFSRRAAGTVSAIVDALNTARDGTPSERAGNALRRQLDRARKCRSAIETQFPGAVVRGFGQNDVDRLRVALHSVQKGLADMADQAEVPDWMRSLPNEIVWSINSTLHALAAALRDDVDEESRDAVARRARILRGHINQALTQQRRLHRRRFRRRCCCSRRSHCSEVARSLPNPSRRQGSWLPTHPRSSAPRNQRVTAPLLRPTQDRHRTVKPFRRRWRSPYRRSSPL